MRTAYCQCPSGALHAQGISCGAVQVLVQSMSVSLLLLQSDTLAPW